MKSVSVSFFCILLAYSASSQNIDGSLVSAYQELSNSNYSVKWSIGDLLPEPLTANDLTISGGLAENIVFNITAINSEISSHNSVIVFPNPFAKTLVVESEEILLDESIVEFYNALGKKQYVPILELRKNSARFFTEDLPSGFYILKIRNIALDHLTHIKVIRE